MTRTNTDRYPFEGGPKPLTDEEARPAGDGGIEHSGKIDAAPNSVKAIGDNAFRDRYALLSVTIPDRVDLSAITFPKNTGSIGRGAFQGCEGLRSAAIPKSVNRIGEVAFKDRKNVTVHCTSPSRPADREAGRNSDRPVVWDHEP